jgi:hypothetical protein
MPVALSSRREDLLYEMRKPVARSSQRSVGFRQCTLSQAGLVLRQQKSRLLAGYYCLARTRANQNVYIRDL